MLRPNNGDSGSVCSLRSNVSNRSQLSSGGRSGSTRNRNELAAMVSVRRRIQDQDPGSRLGSGDSASVKQIVLELGKKLIRFGIRALVFSAAFSILMVRVIQTSASRRTSMNAAFVVMRPQNVTNYYSVQRKTADRPQFNQSLIGQPGGHGLLQNQSGVNGQLQGNSGGLGGGAGGLLGTPAGATGGLLLGAGGGGGLLLNAGGGATGGLGVGGGVSGGLLGARGAGGLLVAGGGNGGGILGGGILSAGDSAAGGILGAGAGGLLGSSGAPAGNMLVAGGRDAGGGVLAANGQQSGNLPVGSSQANGILMGGQPQLQDPGGGLNGTLVKQNGQLMSNQGQLVGGKPEQQLGQEQAPNGGLQGPTGQNLNGLQSGGVSGKNALNSIGSGSQQIGTNLQSNTGGDAGLNLQLGNAASTGLQLSAQGGVSGGGPTLGLASTQMTNVVAGGISISDNANGSLGNDHQLQGLQRQGLQDQDFRGNALPLGQVQGLQLGTGSKGGQNQMLGGMAGQQLYAGGQDESFARAGAGGSINTKTTGLNSMASVKVGEAGETSLKGSNSENAVASGGVSQKIGDDMNSGGATSGQLRQKAGESLRQTANGADDGANGELDSGLGTNKGETTRSASSTKSRSGLGATKGKLRGTVGQSEMNEVGSRGSSGSGTAKLSSSSSAMKSRSLDNFGGDSDESASFSNTRSSTKKSSGSTSKGTKKLRGTSGSSRSN